MRFDLYFSSGRSLRSTPATARSSGPPPGGGCGPLGLFKAEIQNSKLNSGHSLQLADAYGIKSFRDQPAAERRSLRRRGAALRPGAAAGCRSCRTGLLASIFATASGCGSRRGRFCWPMFTLGRQLAKRLHERTRGAGLRGAKLRPAAASENPQIQHSKF